MQEPWLGHGHAQNSTLYVKSQLATICAGLFSSLFLLAKKGLKRISSIVNISTENKPSANIEVKKPYFMSKRIQGYKILILCKEYEQT